MKLPAHSVCADVKPRRDLELWSYWTSRSLVTFTYFTSYTLYFYINIFAHIVYLPTVEQWTLAMLKCNQNDLNNVWIRSFCLQFFFKLQLLKLHVNVFFLILRGFFFLNKMFVTFAQLLDIYSPKTHAEVLKIDDICGWMIASSVSRAI